MTKRITFCSLVALFCMAMSFLESRFLSLPTLPGVKLGLANAAVLWLFAEGHFKHGIAVNLVRVFLSSLLFSGVFSLAFSLSGALASAAVMFLLYKTKLFSLVGLSVAGAAAHNLAQVGVFCLIYGSAGIVPYIAFLLAGGVVCGILCGIAARVLNARCGKLLNKFWS